jgi:hypothetical protein
MRLKLSEERVFVAHFSYHPEKDSTVCILHPAPCSYSIKEDGKEGRICVSHRTHGHVGVGRRKGSDAFTYSIGRKQAFQSALRSINNRQLRADLWKAYWTLCKLENYTTACKNVFRQAVQHVA